MSLSTDLKGFIYDQTSTASSYSYKKQSYSHPDNYGSYNTNNKFYGENCVDYIEDDITRYRYPIYKHKGKLLLYLNTAELGLKKSYGERIIVLELFKTSIPYHGISFLYYYYNNRLRRQLKYRVVDRERVDLEYVVDSFLKVEKKDMLTFPPKESQFGSPYEDSFIKNTDTVYNSVHENEIEENKKEETYIKKMINELRKDATEFCKEVFNIN